MSEDAVERWPSLLRHACSERDSVAQELRALLVRAALAYLARQQYPPTAFGADSYETIAEDAAQDALVIILRQIDTFRGDCRFTTWCYRIVINLLADEVRRRAWRHHPLATDALGGAAAHTVPDALERLAERHALWALLAQIIRHELTPRQRQALIGRVVEEKPLVVLAAELGTDKDNVYKLLHDARKHLKRALMARGLTVDDVFMVAERKTVQPRASNEVETVIHVQED